MIIHLIQRTGCFQACGDKRKRCMCSDCAQRERVEGREWGRGRGWAFLSSLQEHKGQSNTSSGVVAKTANLALFLLLYFCTTSLSVNLSLCLSLAHKYENMSRKCPYTWTLLPLCSPSWDFIASALWTFTLICMLSLWNSANALTCVIVLSHS